MPGYGPMAAVPEPNIPIGNVYPYTGPTGGQIATAAASPDGNGIMQITRPTAGGLAANAANVGLLGQSWHYWLGIVILLIVIKYIGQNYAGNDEFKTMRVSAWNVLVITLSAAVGFAIFKAAATKWPFPGWSTFWLAV